MAGSVTVVLGTRPEIIKLAPVIAHLGAAAQIIHTGQHYDPAVSGMFFSEYGLPDPVAHLGTGGSPRATQVGVALGALDRLFALRRPAVVVVQGDTNSTVAGALAANAHGIPLVHVEAGLRSFDRRMPEEHNRILTDHLADLLCAPTAQNAANLCREGIPGNRIALTGNTVVEAVRTQLPAPATRRQILAGYDIRPDRYVLATIHRPENTDDPEVLTEILRQLDHIAARGWPVILPVHPRTTAALRAARCDALLRRLRLVEPLPHNTFLALAKHAALLISDSGGLQEEVTELKRPLIVVRRSTERPEAAAFAELVAPGQPIAQAAHRWLDQPWRLATLAAQPSPYGDGTAGRAIAERTMALMVAC